MNKQNNNKRIALNNFKQTDYRATYLTLTKLKDINKLSYQ